MKIAVLSHKDVSGYYAATLMERGHQIVISGGGAIHAEGLKPYLECDGCLLLSSEPDLLEIADYMETFGKKIWRSLADIPSHSSKKKRAVSAPRPMNRDKNDDRLQRESTS
jgi:hypothetical protein